PASHANTMFAIGAVATEVVAAASAAPPADAEVARFDRCSDFLPLFASVCAMAAASGSPLAASAAMSRLRLALRMIPQRRKGTAAETKTEQMPPRTRPSAV